MESRLEHLVCVTPDDFRRRGPALLETARWKLLAHGDSWFSFTSERVDAHANLLEELVFSQPTLAVSCAGHHNALRRMIDLEGSADFLRLLGGDTAWDGILLSMGGNDLVSAATVPALQPGGEATPLHLRLLRRQTEWDAPSKGVSRYFTDRPKRRLVNGGSAWPQPVERAQRQDAGLLVEVLHRDRAAGAHQVVAAVLQQRVHRHHQEAAQRAQQHQEGRRHPDVGR
jgi:hypothetical protein